MREDGGTVSGLHPYSTTDERSWTARCTKSAGSHLAMVAGDYLLHRVFDAQLALLKFDLKEKIFRVEIGGQGELFKLCFIPGMLLRELLKFWIAGQEVFANFPGRDGHQFPPCW